MRDLISWFATGCLLVSLQAVAVDAPPPPPPPTSLVLPTAGTNAPGPRIQFSTPVYDFGRVKAGDVVKYSFVFTNTGDEALQVTHVQPSCGCTTAGDFTKKVEPGQIGSVPIQFNSANFNGQVFKTISVSSNDKHQPTTVLQLKGAIWKPVELVPPYTILTIPPDAASASASVRVINNLEQPMDVFDPVCTNPVFTVEILTNRPGKEFEVKITARPPANGGNIQGKVSLKTTSTNTPTLDVPFWANVQPAVLMVPQQLMLPTAPLTTKSTPSVTIQNNSTNTLTLSEPKISVPGGEVQIKEMQPGKLFSVMFTFPEGFSLPPGQQAFFSVKSSNPKYPELKVPILQMPPRFATPGAPIPVSSKTASTGIGGASPTAPTVQAK